MLSGCQRSEPAAAAAKPPAKIEHPDEAGISRVVLTTEAEQRLKVTTAPIQRQRVPRHRLVSGEVTVPDGATVVVTAPLTGRLQVPSGQSAPVPGQTVQDGQVLFELAPLLSPEREVPTAAERVAMASATASLVSSQITAEGDMKQAQAEVDAAEIALARARRLFDDKVGSAREVDDAVARLEIAQEAFNAAKGRKELLDRLTLEAQSGAARPVSVESPRSGLLRSLSSSTGHLVTAGSPLFEIVELSTVWVRVPVYPGWRSEISASANVAVRPLGEADNDVTATPVEAPPSADALAATVDLYFQLDNPDRRFHPGERVEVALPLGTDGDVLVLPRAAVLRDIHGFAWVYTNPEPHVFQRARVEIEFTTSELSVLSRGPAEGTSVVVDGAAELFGTEFGAGK